MIQDVDVGNASGDDADAYGNAVNEDDDASDNGDDDGNAA